VGVYWGARCPGVTSPRPQGRRTPTRNRHMLELRDVCGGEPQKMGTSARDLHDRPGGTPGAPRDDVGGFCREGGRVE
jgi:hypothetical protein